MSFCQNDIIKSGGSLLKKIYSIVCACALIFSLAIPVFAVDASDNQTVLSTQQFVTDDGITITQELIIQPQTRATYSTTASLKSTFTRSGATIAIIAITGTFKYTGTSVSVTSKSVSQKDTYNGWSFNQSSFTSSGGTIKLTGKLTKLLLSSTSFTMTLSCDKNGNLTSS